MKIAVIGATGKTGRAVVELALAHQHTVTAMVRNAAKAEAAFGQRVAIVEKDALALTPEELKGYDAVVDAFASRQAAYQHLDLATRLIATFRGDEHTIVAFILGASSLREADGSLVIDRVLAKNAGADWVETPKQQAYEYQYLQWVDNVRWTAISPQFEFVDGPAGNYRLGQDDLMTDPAGKSIVTTGNLAAALLAELEHPAHLRQRFTVVND
ncbi:NAD(P)H-binding protein [Lacticaseibacillus baoqingensis]|uniref:NAD(P)H-binding protein n=1 Tax=Lacticaseibacillus baoqingensis TaxID=2486013 RepID=A0ABW4E7C1_9LACO|nr:NAD(P)H-binding protein [Lacticaseibacillus baoqingensis]